VPDRQEESLIDEMRATIRADRERAAARVERTPAPAPAPPVEPPPEPAPRPFLRRLLGR
jgi:hypothetical protein